MKWLEHRIPPLVIFVMCAGVMWGTAQLIPGWIVDTPYAVWLGLSCIVAGAALALAGVWSFHRHRTTVNPLSPERATRLVDDGVYRFSRHPMYAGLLLVLIGMWAILAHPVAGVGTLLFYVVIDRFQIDPEERAMAKLFGEEYLAYAKKVRRWM